MTSDLAKIQQLLDPNEEVQGCTDADLQRISELYGHPLPADYVEAVGLSGGYNGHLRLPDGSEGGYLRINSADDVIASDGYDTVNELGIAVADTGGDWAWVLQFEDGIHRYVDVDLGSGDILNECDTFAELLEQVNLNATEDEDHEDDD